MVEWIDSSRPSPSANLGRRRQKPSLVSGFSLGASAVAHGMPSVERLMVL